MSVTYGSDGQPLIVRDSHLASRNFGLNGQLWKSVPKSKFLFYVRFVKSNNSTSVAQQNSANSPGLSALSSIFTTGVTASSFSTLSGAILPNVLPNATSSAWSNGVGLVAKTIERPKLKFDLKTLNQYNKKRVIQTKVEYEPVNFVFHDTVNNIVNSMFHEYFSFYYGDAIPKSLNSWMYDVTTQQYQFPTANGSWGFVPPSVAANNSNFFNSVEIYQIYGGKYSQIDLVNPKIGSYNPDGLDYSSGDGAEISINLTYEGVVYVATDQSLASNPNLISAMSLNLSDYFEPTDAQAIASLAGGTGLFGSMSDTSNLVGNFLNQSLSTIAGNALSGRPLNAGSAFSNALTSQIGSALQFTNNNLIRAIANGDPSRGLIATAEQAASGFGLGIFQNGNVAVKDNSANSIVGLFK